MYCSLVGVFATAMRRPHISDVDKLQLDCLASGGFGSYSAVFKQLPASDARLSIEPTAQGSSVLLSNERSSSGLQLFSNLKLRNAVSLSGPGGTCFRTP